MKNFEHIIDEYINEVLDVKDGLEHIASKCQKRPGLRSNIVT